MRPALALLLSLSACSSPKPADPLAAPLAALPAVATAAANGQTARMRAADEVARALSAEDSAPFVHPDIAERSRLLGARLEAAASANTARVGTATYAALSSDGSIYVAKGGAALQAFTRPFAQVPVVREALMSGTPGTAVAAFPPGTEGRARFHAAAVRAAGAVVGAIVVVVPLEDDAAAAQTSARAANGGAGAEACVRIGTDSACTAPAAASAQAAANATPARVQQSGVVVRKTASEGTDVVVFLPRPAAAATSR